MIIMEQIKEKEKIKIEELKKKDDNSLGELVVLNDDFNTFVYVITTLMTCCGITQEFAIECTFKIHNDGGCTILKDNKSVLYPICDNLVECGLSALVQDSEEK